MWPEVRARFSPTGDGKLVSKRMETEREAYEQFRKQQQRKGKSGAMKRWPRLSSGYSSAMAQAKPNDSSASASASASSDPPLPPLGDEWGRADFEAAWLTVRSSPPTGNAEKSREAVRLITTLANHTGKEAATLAPDLFAAFDAELDSWKIQPKNRSVEKFVEHFDAVVRRLNGSHQPPTNGRPHPPEFVPEKHHPDEWTAPPAGWKLP
jgi:hypothetical protein